MVQKIKVEGFDAFQSKLEELKKEGKTIYVLFSGTKDESGKRKIGLPKNLDNFAGTQGNA